MSKIVYIEAEINGSIQDVYNCLTNPEAIKKWNFASEEWHCPNAKVDLVIGGKQHTRMESKDGKFGFDFNLTFTNIVQNKRLSYVMEDGRLWDIQLSRTQNGVLVQEFFEIEDENSEELQLSGWGAILTNFKKYIESDFNY